MINFPFVPNGKLIILGVPILKHITVDLGDIDSKVIGAYSNVNQEYIS